MMLLAVLLLVFPVHASADAPTPVAKADTIYKVTVDCDLPKAIEAGKYGWVDPDISPKNFPEPGCKSGEVDINLVHFGRKVRTYQALAELESRNLRPVTLLELLALGSAYPDLKRKFWIVALGSSWPGPVDDRGGPFLSVYFGERNLSLRWRVLPEAKYFAEGEWLADFRFAAVRK